MKEVIESLETEKMGLIEQILELDRIREELPMAAELEEMRSTLERLKKYEKSLGLFHRGEQRRVREQILRKEEEIAQREVDLENEQGRIEDQISDLNLARQAIETEIERLRGQN